jgi:carbamate kinase
MRSAIRFVEAGGTRAVIAELDEGPAALRGEAGTELDPD